MLLLVNLPGNLPVLLILGEVLFQHKLLILLATSRFALLRNTLKLLGILLIKR